MTNFPNLEFPISNADCAEIEAIFIELMRGRDDLYQAPADVDISNKPTSNPPFSARDF
jgi:hypothetical protein